ncbi:glycosyltransferase family 4 protein [Pseudothioglobus sp. nBUS_23]|uniref:glycosyltransferase family 4 protein n=1 Tax=Pseudothioglobus sp. nBUS_23 TaxID=3395318 RepID=UPI003EB7BA1F
MKKIIYLIPLDSIGGGVEVAAKGVRNINNPLYSFNVEYIFKNKADLFDISMMLKAVQRVYSLKPDVLILSLWRAQFVGILFKLISPRTKIIFFVHSAEDAHFLDYFLSRLTLLISSEVWADSATSLKERFNHSSLKINNGRVISFSARKISKLKVKKVKPSFIFWGRVGKEKGVERAIKIFSKILKFYPNATFTIIGSDGGTLKLVKRLCKELEIQDSVIFFNEMNFDEIEKKAANACFYLQTSLYEGAAMSVMESMKLGLVPIVTPVGEISKYCDSSNSVLVFSDQEVARDVIMILKNSRLYDVLSTNASLKFKSQLTYIDSIKNSCNDMIKKLF